jgi:exosortase/archaeosortase family protein
MIREDLPSRKGINKTHFSIGMIISIVIALFVAMDGHYFRFMADTISALLSFAGVQFNLFMLGTTISLLEGIPLYYQRAGPTFEIPVQFTAPDPLVTIALIAIIGLASVVIYRSKRVMLPIKSICIVLATLVVATLVYVVFASPLPAHRLSWVTVDWRCSGVVVLVLISLIFTPFLFTVKGPLWIKLFWLGSTLVFSVVWNIIRLSLTIASLYYFGDVAFLLLHYLAGVFVDFIYIVTFYSLALSHLAKHEVSVTGW